MTGTILKLSFRADINLGKTIGTKGEKKIRIVIGYDGKVWTAFPVKLILNIILL